jgi:Ca-activated chloride channel family protein
LNLETFHFLRPEWLWALLLLIPIGWSVVRRVRSAGAWERICDPHLLPHLVAQTQRGGARWLLLLLALGWSAASLALAGPAWEKLPQQTFREPDRTVFVLGLGETMSGRDVKPSRIARARHKLLDAVDRAKGGSVALVVYREEAFAVTPLTDDANVLREVIPLLDTKLMPGRAVRTARGIEEALRLLEPVGARGARIVLVTDGADDDEEATAAAVRDASDAGARVSVLGVAGLTDALAALAHGGGGASAALAIDDSDLDVVLASGGAADALSGASLTKSDIRSDDWRDMGAWLLWIPLSLAPFAFRRGWAAAIAALLFLQLAPTPAHAAEFDLFQRPDQKGARAFAAGRFEESAQQFEDPDWKAAAHYRAGDYAGAAETLAPQTDPLSQYNLGNALAKAGKLEDAVAAYDRALVAAPNDEDARFNRDLVKKLLDEQSQQDPQSQDDSSDSQQGDESKQPRDSGASKSDESQAQHDAQKSQDPSAQDGSQGDPGDEPKQAETGEPSPDQAQQDPQGEQAEQKDGEAGEPRDEASAAEPQQQEAQQANPGEAGEPSDEEREDGTPGMNAEPQTAEAQQRAQWMARLPDDPGGLLRERIRRDFLRKRAERNGGGR